MTLSTALKQTEDVADNAITTTFFQGSAGGNPIDNNYTLRFPGDPAGTPEVSQQIIQTTSLIGDGFEYLISFDVKYFYQITRTATKTLFLQTVQTIFNADGATLILNQTEADYNGAGNNGQFVGGTGYIVNEVITMDDECTITVDAVSGGIVTQFTITAIETGEDYIVPKRRLQDSSDGSGINFWLYIGDNNTVLPESTYMLEGTRTDTLFASDQFGVDTRRNTGVVLALFEKGVQYNFGSWNSKVRSEAADSIGGSIEGRFIQYLKVKR